MSANFAAYRLDAERYPNNPRKPISTAWVNSLLGAAEAAIDAAGGGTSQFTTPQDFGAVGDGVTDDTDAFEAALDHLDGNLAGINGASRLWIPTGTYKLSRALNIRATMLIEGESKFGSRLEWSGDSTGIIVQRVNTDDGLTGDAPAWTVGGGDETRISNLTLAGGFNGTEGEFHGIALRARATVEHLLIDNWGGWGIYSLATAGGGAQEGNVNCAHIYNVTGTRNLGGMFVDGADTNVWSVIGCDFRTNRTWGIWDSSFLGNTYLGCHVAGNGWDGAATSIPTGCSVSLGGGLYIWYYVKVGQETWCKTNAPTGTLADNQGWGVIGQTSNPSYWGVVPWVSGTDFRPGGAYQTDNANARNCFYGCYSESDSNPSVMTFPTLVSGGLHGAGVIGVGIMDGRNMGPVSGEGGDQDFNLNNTGGIGARSSLNFVSNAPGGATTQAQIFALNGASGGYIYYTANGGVHRFRGVSDAQLAELSNAGLDLSPGGLYKIDGTQVVGARGAAVADATDAASTQARLNDLLARLRAHGLIAT